MAEKLPVAAVDNTFNEYSTIPDANNIYTIMSYKRRDGSLYMKSTLSDPDASGNYLTMKWDFYDTDGTTLLYSQTWTLTYDAQGNVTSKVVTG